jgi:hypothetical protein
MNGKNEMYTTDQRSFVGSLLALINSGMIYVVFNRIARILPKGLLSFLSFLFDAYPYHL